MGLAESKEPGKEVSLGRRDRYVVKWRRNMEDTKQGKFIWYETISPGDAVWSVSRTRGRLTMQNEGLSSSGSPDMSGTEYTILDNNGL